MSRKKEQTFIENGGKLLEGLIGSNRGRCCPIRCFSAKELEQATNNYDWAHFSDYNAHYTWYKGCVEGRTVAIKKPCDDDPSSYNDVVINDIVIAVQTNPHNNVLRLVGCCLETPIPIRVYEHADNGILRNHIFPYCKNHMNPLLLKSRLRIATEIANAIAYLHTAFVRPIIHRDIHLQNIVLDQHYVAKLSDFALSVMVPEGEKHVEGAVVGTSGFGAAPEYMAKGIASEKGDVYSFGILLMELFTGKRFYEPGNRTLGVLLEEQLNADQVDAIVAWTYVEEGGGVDVQRQVKAAMRLALRCIKTDMEERPTIVEVAKQLKQIAKSVP